MKKLIAVAVALFSVAALARESVNITHYGQNGRNRSYYACSYAESQTEAFLKVFGASNIDVRCFGGIQSFGMPQPVSIRASFDLPEVTTSVVEAIRVEGDRFSPACGLNVQIVNALLKVFPNIEVVKKSSSCAFTTSNYYYDLLITR